MTERWWPAFLPGDFGTHRRILAMPDEFANFGDGRSRPLEVADGEADLAANVGIRSGGRCLRVLLPLIGKSLSMPNAIADLDDQ